MCAFSYSIIDDQLAFCFLMLIVSYAMDVIWKQEITFDIMKWLHKRWEELKA